MRHLTFVPLAAILLLATAADRPAGYLAPGAVNLMPVVPAVPAAGDARDATDKKVYLAMAKQVGSPRWDLATRDVASGVADLMSDFSCAAGVTLSPTATPATFKLLSNVNMDTQRENNVVKEHYKRLRPFLADNGAICDKSKDIATTYDYPSGHSTRGWAFEMALADLLPDHKAALATRARAYGESRLVCRVHTVSAVEAGRISATTTMAAIRKTTGYQADLAAARAELAAAHSAPDGASCAKDQPLIAQTVLAAAKP